MRWKKESLRVRTARVYGEYEELRRITATDIRLLDKWGDKLVRLAGELDALEAKKNINEEREQAIEMPK